MTDGPHLIRVDSGGGGGGGTRKSCCGSAAEPWMWYFKV